MSKLINRTYITIVLTIGMLLLTGMVSLAEDNINYGETYDLVNIESDGVKYGCVFWPTNKTVYILEVTTEKEEVQIPAYITYYGKDYRVDLIRESYYVTDDEKSNGWISRDTIKKLTAAPKAKNFSIVGWKWKRLEEVRIPAKVSRLDLGGYLKAQVVIDPANKKFKTAGNGVYTKNGKKLVNTFGRNDRIKVKKGTLNISSCAFNRNIYVEKITMANTVKKIEDGKKSVSAFGKCTSLREVVCSSNLEQIGKWSFAGCKKLSKVVIQNKEKAPKIAKNAFDRTKKGIKFIVKNKKVGKDLERQLHGTRARNFKIVISSKID